MTVHRYLALLLTLLVVPAALAQQPFDAPWFGFNAGTTPFTGNLDPTLRYPSAVTTSDLDGDGDGDRELVVANSEQQVTVLVNNGSGAFPTRTTYGPLFPPRAGSLDADVVLATGETGSTTRRATLIR